MHLVICHDRLIRDAAVTTDVEVGPERPGPDLPGAGPSPRTGDLSPWPPRPGHPDGLSDQLGGTTRPLHAEFGEHGARQLLHRLAGLLALQRAHGLHELFQAKGTDPG